MSPSIALRFIEATQLSIVGAATRRDRKLKSARGRASYIRLSRDSSLRKSECL